MQLRNILLAILFYVSAIQGISDRMAFAANLSIAEASRPAIRGILYNEDDDHRFDLAPAGTMKPEHLDKLVDELANSQVTTMLICCNAQTTCYRSKVWDVIGDGFDPAKDNQQPFFGDMANEFREFYRRRAHNLKVLLDAGIDPNQRMIDQCRKKNIRPWVSIRMNDVHDAHLLKSPFHSRFWMEHPEYWRRNSNPCGSWLDRCLNYGEKPVRDHMMALIREVCNRYDMDGLELDWNRFPAHFREGEEIEQGKALTEWMAEVREVVRAAEKKWKHPILLVPRVPARPDVSYGIGLDAVTWAKRGLIDHLIVAPFFGTTDYDIPVEQWIELLKGTGVGVTAGLEIRVQPHPSAPVLPNTPERRRGAAMAALARGSQGIYLFNHYDIGGTMPFLLNEMHSVDSLVNKDRIYTVTYADIAIPGKPILAALPKSLKSGESAEFRLFIGPKPLTTAKAEVQLILKPEKEGEKCTAQVMLNGHPPTANAGYAFNADAFQEGYNVVRVVNAGTLAATVESVELALRFPPSEKNGVGSPVPGLPATPEAPKKSQPAPQDNPPAKQSLRALHKADRVIAVSGQGYFPVMIKLSDGSLGAVLRGGAGHLGIGGRLDSIRSPDGGRTWSKPVVAIDSPSDDRNPAFGQMPDGTLVLAYAELHGYRPDGTFDWNAGPCLPFYITSNDGGKTWSAKRPLTTPWPNASPFGKITVCKDGTALLSLYQTPSNGVAILRSKDNGKTWGDASTVPGNDETQVIELPDGRLMAFSRLEGKTDFGLLLSESDDKGYTWVRSRKLMKPQQWPFDATVLKSGHLLMSYGTRVDRFGAGVVLSKDLGKTWDEEHRVLLGWDSLNTDTGYPSTVQLDDGTIVTMYYAVGTATSAETQAIVVRYTEEQLAEAMLP